MIEHVYRRAAEARTVDAVIVATDDERIRRVVETFGGRAALTRADHASGTDRLAEVAAIVPCRVVVNVQGDEPLVDPAVIDAVVQPLLADPGVEMTTACRPIETVDELSSPHVVKVVRDERGRALYFSRAAIPHRGPGAAPSADAALSAARAHVGLYGYRRDVLLRLAALQPSELELVESLEQLRALAHGIAIQVVETTHRAAGVDTPADLERVRQSFLSESRT